MLSRLWILIFVYRSGWLKSYSGIGWCDNRAGLCGVLRGNFRLHWGVCHTDHHWSYPLPCAGCRRGQYFHSGAVHAARYGHLENQQRRPPTCSWHCEQVTWKSGTIHVADQCFGGNLFLPRYLLNWIFGTFFFTKNEHVQVLSLTCQPSVLLLCMLAWRCCWTSCSKSPALWVCWLLIWRGKGWASLWLCLNFADDDLNFCRQIVWMCSASELPLERTMVQFLKGFCTKRLR